ncbi:Ferredoxin--sulfite reductase [hydrothermal vent metagenome]|uniref:Ferredoxin--sulfite reductase n=1 Tax=hydrothermal vent metagenome TaxID=652676 RepID=A0A3B1D267_9ZZZZ
MSSTCYELPEGLDEAIIDFEEVVEQFKKGEMSLTEFKVVRVPFGVYEQRKHDTYMIRIRCGGAVIEPLQLKKLGEISNVHSSDYVHLTTRQEIQLHYALVDNIIPVMHELKSVGLLSRGGGGNTVRNIMSAVDSGIIEGEAFDVTPYAIALTTRLITEDDSWNLPRKFKITFSGESADCNHATIHDLGYIAKMKDGKKGFKVYIAGGCGAKTGLGNVLFDFIDDTEVYNIAKATKNLFYKNGDRRNKHASRLRFLWKKLGEETFLKKWNEEYDAVKKENYPPLTIEELNSEAIDPNFEVEQPSDQKDFDLWEKRFVTEQKQKGQYSIIVPIHLGHLDNAQAIALGDYLNPFGKNTIRIAKDQNLHVRNILEKYLPNFYNFLKINFKNFNRPLILDKMIACAGASTCQLGICLSPGTATATQRILSESNLDLDVVSDAKVHISGCPNSCGMHHAADLGFFGKVARAPQNHVIPSFNVLVGAKLKDGDTELAQKIGDIAARRAPDLIKETFEAYISKKDNFQSFNAYVRSDEGKEAIKGICNSYKEIPELSEDKSYYRDWGTDNLFSSAGRGKGECSAGIFDLIELDLGNIQQNRKLVEEINENGGSDEQKAQLLKDITFYCSRNLLVTRGVQPKHEQQAYDLFREHFINEDLVDASFDELLKLAETKQLNAFLNKEDQVIALADRLKLLFDVMTPGFQFNLPDDQIIKNAQKIEIKKLNPTETPSATDEALNIKAKTVKDFRGVACPMNFVKTKMELSKLQTKDILEIWLDDGAPIQNVPGSVRQEGHKILEETKTGEYWTVLIEKN